MSSVHDIEIPSGLPLDQIPKEGLDLYYDDVSDVLQGAGLPEPLRPVEGELHLVRKGQTVRLQGVVKGTLSLLCDRCLEPYILDVTHPFTYLMLPLEGHHFKPEIELTPEEAETSFYEDEMIPIRAILREQILLEIPMKGLCSPHCKGLCPGCGTNMNVGSCSCPPEQEEGPFSVLKELLG